MRPEYEAWIREHYPDRNSALVMCSEATTEMVAAFPELNRVAGHYRPVLGGSLPHWWCVDAEGTIVDPTAIQFRCQGQGEYVPWVGELPNGRCMNCGEYTFAPRRYACSDECDKELVESMQ